jgi:hypothetical protein
MARDNPSDPERRDSETRAQGPCPSCGAEWIPEEIAIADRGHGDVPKTLSLMLRMKPWAILFKGTRYFPLTCRVCAGCGHVELQARDIPALKEALRSRAQGMRRR